jgi:toxin HigB-1
LSAQVISEPQLGRVFFFEEYEVVHDTYCISRRAMIKSFKCKETFAIWNGQVSRRLPRDIQERAFSKMRILNAARTVDDLKVPVSNHLEVLKKERKGQMSIRINKQWRLCFEWDGHDALDVEIVDYH